MTADAVDGLGMMARFVKNDLLKVLRARTFLKSVYCDGKIHTIVLKVAKDATKAGGAEAVWDGQGR